VTYVLQKSGNSSHKKEEKMERENLKKVLAGFGIATLIAGAGLSGAGNAWAA
jgi:radical SAM modification target selenobiotic family peptide